jgi:hypothetical protein
MLVVGHRVGQVMLDTKKQQDTWLLVRRQVDTGTRDMNT